MTSTHLIEVCRDSGRERIHDVPDDIFGARAWCGGSVVESAQQRIVDVVRRLEESGEIIIAGRGGESEMIV